MDLRTNKKKDGLYTAVALIALIVVLLVMELTMKSTSIFFTVLKKGAIYALVAVSMNLLNGFTGLFSLGQAGFMLIGAFIIGIAENIIKGLGWTTFSDAFTFALLIVILLVKPTGLFGEKATDKV